MVLIFCSIAQFDKINQFLYNRIRVQKTQRSCIEVNSFVIETLGCIFTAIDGKVKILLMRKKTEPYKGYWILPGDKLNKGCTVEENIAEALNNKIGYSDLSLNQGSIFSTLDRVPNKRVLAVSFISLIDSTSIELKKDETNEETEWFDVNMLPKLGYDHEQIIKDAIDNLSQKLQDFEILKQLFPSDFTLPEIQKVYEQILNINLDRRNFRKKLINLGIIEPTGEYNNGNNGRPALLYRFKTVYN